MGGKQFGCSRIETFHRAIKLLVGVAHEEVGKEEEVGAALRELRHVDGELVDAVIEVFAESSLAYGIGKVLVRGAYQAYVDGNLLRATDRTDAAFLQGAKQLHLHVIAQIAHLVEEQRAAVSSFEGAALVRIGTRERTFLMTEKL